MICEKCFYQHRGICKFVNNSYNKYYVNRNNMVCRYCYNSHIEDLKKDKLKWFNEVKVILENKLTLYNNDINLSNNILEFVGITEQMIENQIYCDTCSKNICNVNVNKLNYYYVCGDCLHFN